MEKRKVIGLFVANVEDDFSKAICIGALRAAEEKDVNLIIFPGNYFYNNSHLDNETLKYEYQYNTLFHYSSEKSLDALAICVGSICCRAGLEERARLLKLANGVPMISIASKEEQCTSIRYDNVTGIRDGIHYLVKEQHCAHIGMIGGTLDNDDSVERMDTYRKTLLGLGIEVKEDYIALGDFTDGCGAVIEELLERHPEIDALICANDDMARAAYPIIQQMELEVGKDIKIIGFDDVPDCTKLNPPLATVRADAAELGYEAICNCLTLKNDDEPKDIILKTNFIKRESAGFRSYDMQEFIANFSCLSDSRFDVNAISANLTEYVFHEVHHDYQAACQEQILLAFFIKLLSRFFAQVIKRNSIDDIYLFFEHMVERGILTYTEPRKMIQVFDTIYQVFCSKNKIMSNRLELHNLMARMEQKLMEWMSIEMARREKDTIAVNHITNYITRDILMLQGEAEENYAHSLGQLINMDIRHSFLYVWETPQENLKGQKWIPPEYALLKAYQKDKDIVSVPRTDQKVMVEDLFCHTLFGEENRYSYFVLDLFSKSDQLGLYICDIPDKYMSYTEFLTYQLSSAVRTINLFQLQKVTQKMLEESLESLQANNIKLGTISNSDELTGIWNRRGFYHLAEKYLNQWQDGYSIVCYADMDCLKTVNDTFGHDEGDFAIRACAQILRDTFGETSIVGRIGGDEFAVIIYQEQSGQIRFFRRRMEVVTDQINQKSEKPYPIRMSAGMREFHFREGLELKLMIDEVDDLLYIEKKKRKGRS